MKSSLQKYWSIKKYHFLIIPFFLLIPGGISLMSWFSFLNNYRELQMASESHDWPSQKGVITDSYEKYNSGEEGGYYFNVEYTYIVGGILYSGDKLDFSDSHGNRPYVRKIVNRYPEGKEVTVFFKPGDPEISVLQPGVTQTNSAKVASDLVFLCVGGFMCMALLYICVMPPTKDSSLNESG